MNRDPDYSAAYVVLRTDVADGLEGHGLTFTTGRGTEVVVAGVHAIEPLVLGRSVEAIDAVVFTSGSTVRGLVALAQAEQLDIASIPSVCIGIRTAAEARGAGFSVLAVSETPDANVLARTVARSLKTLVYP